MSLRCGLFGWHSFKLVSRGDKDNDTGSATVECCRCRRRMRVHSDRAGSRVIRRAGVLESH